MRIIHPIVLRTTYRQHLYIHYFSSPELTFYLIKVYYKLNMVFTQLLRNIKCCLLQRKVAFVMNYIFAFYRHQIIIYKIVLSICTSQKPVHAKSIKIPITLPWIMSLLDYFGAGWVTLQDNHCKVGELHTMTLAGCPLQGCSHFSFLQQLLLATSGVAVF